MKSPGKSIDRIIQVKDVNIGKNLRTLRENNGFSQVDFVNRLQLSGIDVSVFSYNRIEKGTQNPTVSLLSACCNLLNCDMNLIFGISKDDDLNYSSHQ